MNTAWVCLAAAPGGACARAPHSALLGSRWRTCWASRSARSAALHSITCGGGGQASARAQTCSAAWCSWVVAAPPHRNCFSAPPYLVVQLRAHVARPHKVGHVRHHLQLQGGGPLRRAAGRLLREAACKCTAGGTALQRQQARACSELPPPAAHLAQVGHGAQRRLHPRIHRLLRLHLRHLVPAVGHCRWAGRRQAGRQARRATLGL